MLFYVKGSVAFTLDVLAEEESQGLRKTSESRVEQLLVRWTLIVDFTNTFSVLQLFSIWREVSLPVFWCAELYHESNHESKQLFENNGYKQP